jgi:CelD/BcsL family acetyltransferase involved in cellulose biosynthesis
MLSAANGNLLLLKDNWTDQHFGMPKTFRKELERSWRVFSRADGAAFTIVTDGGEALKLLARMEQAQRARMAELGQPYHMEDPVTAGLYRRLMAAGVPSGFAYLTVLTAGEEMVAALLGLRDGENYVMTRLVHAGDAWSKVSPGRLLIHKTMELLHGQGYRRVDFSIGNYAYKRRFGPVRTPLYDIAAPATLLGVPASLRMRAGAFLRRYPQARDTVRRLLGKPSLREEN